ncbi:MAG TPA: VWA domain-containing protein [Pyrinomonadaceae bacterium]|nr:VWA domain-containing protein [Pyrinomonadaceae bacterium]
MKTTSSHAVAATMLASLLCLLPPPRASHAQEVSKPVAHATQQQSVTPYDDEVVRITSNLVQIDATVRDKDGRPVTDLRAEDFEVLEDGRPQQITNLSYVALDAAPVTASEAARRADASRTANAEKTGAEVAPPPPSARLRPGQVRRTVALVVDDLGLSFESIASARASLRKFVDEQMQPGDLVAVVRTSAGVGALQQFTSEKRLLYAAIERVRWYPPGRGGVGAFAAIEKDLVSESNNTAATIRANTTDRATYTGMTAAGTMNLPDQSTSILDLRDTNDLTDRYREELFASGTLGALNFVVRGLKELPGRKSVVLYSDSIPIFRKDGKSERVLETLRRLVDVANRASVVIYSVDARGLQSLALTGADNTSAMTRSSQIRAAVAERGANYFESQNGLSYLAEQTGGLLIHNTNDVAEGVRLALQDQQGYYLIGYRPEDATFDPQTGARRFHELTVRVKRPNLRVRTRNGFYGFTEDEAARPLRASRAAQLQGAINSPFSSGALPLRMTSLFADDPQTGSFMRSLVHLDARSLTFDKQPDGSYRSTIDVLALTYGDDGRVVNQVDRTDTVTVAADRYENVLRHGLVYLVNVPAARPGAYQLRLAVRDAATERVGSASQFVEVPNLSDKRLALSGIVLSGNDLPVAAPTGGVVTSYTGSLFGGAGALEPDPQSGPAIRRLRAGAELFYNFAVYNARSANGQTRLESQVRMFRDGRLMFTGKAMPVEVGAQADASHLLAGGRMKLSAQAAPGEYVFQLVVTDRQDASKPRVASQWIDFEIVK